MPLRCAVSKPDFTITLFVMPDYTIGIDIGGTNTKGGLVDMDAGVVLLEQFSHTEKKDPDRFMDSLVSLVDTGPSSPRIPPLCSQEFIFSVSSIRLYPQRSIPPGNKTLQESRQA